MAKTSIETYTESLIGWYSDRAHPFVSSHAAERIPSLERDRERLQALRDASRRELPICFLGNSGVGKSTLLNAMVGQHLTVLPQGGVGPLTAQATVVKFSSERYFRVVYLPRKRVNEVLFALERHHESNLRAQGQAVEARSEELAAELDEEERAEAEATLPVAIETKAGATGADTSQEDKLDALKRQARLLVQGDQFGEIDLPYLLDGLRVAIGVATRWGTRPRAEDEPRLQRVRAVLEFARKETPAERRAGSDIKTFLGELKLHAAGFLAPLIRTLEVGWDAEFLRSGLVLVDLPGLGVANDEYRRVTAEWIRKARAVVLVVDRSGVNESSADLLRTTGFLNSLLHDSHDPDAAPAHLLVAVVKLDLSADDARREERELQSPPFRKWTEHFDDACRRAIELLKSQVRVELGKIAAAGPDETRPERDATIGRVLDSLEIHPLSAREYRKFVLRDDEEPSKITDISQSRVPAFIESLRRVSDEHARTIDTRLRRAAVEFHEHVASTIELLRAQWEQDSRADSEAERLRVELDAFLAPLRSEFLVRQGEFREFLRSSIPEQIESRLAGAALTAKEDISRYLRRLESYHWSTLRAAVRRGGTYVGAKHVDLPNELTLRFEEPVAVLWTKHILTALRRRTKELGETYVKLVGDVVEWTQQQGTRVQPKLVEALHEQMKGETRELATVGKEAIDELKDRVKNQLFDRISDRVRKSCQKFVEQRKDMGTGTKVRILEFLRDELSQSVVEAAVPAAKVVLMKNYERVQSEITDLVTRYHNPLDTAAAEIVSSEEARLRRSDAQKRKRVLQSVDEVVKAQPKQPAT